MTHKKKLVVINCSKVPSNIFANSLVLTRKFLDESFKNVEVLDNNYKQFWISLRAYSIYDMA